MTSPAAKDEGEPADLSKAFIDLLDNPSLGKWVRDFYDRGKSFAADTFDTLPDEQNDPDRFTASDLLAVTTLDMRVRPLAMRRLLVDDVEVLRPMLNEIRGDCLWTATDEQIGPGYRLFDHLVGRRYPWVGLTTASKLLARKRPGLLPVVDSIVKPVVGTEDYRGTVKVLRSALEKKWVRDLVEATRPPNLDDKSTPTLRLLDTAIWISKSGSRDAKMVRRHAACKLPPIGDPTR